MRTTLMISLMGLIAVGCGGSSRSSTSPGSMMSGRCSALANGTMQINGTNMTMAGTYSGTNSCSGAFNNGQMMMRRQ